jgi:EAL domain-containing protein (putative c-di-GMP-specific phosphodiesterase class I)
LDILKIDIETAEYDVLEQLIEENYMPFSQLRVEFHDNDAGMNKSRYRQILAGLRRNGFVIAKNISDKELTFMKVV